MFNELVYSDSYFNNYMRGADDGADPGDNSLPMGNAPDLSALSALSGSSTAQPTAPDVNAQPSAAPSMPISAPAQPAPPTPQPAAAAAPLAGGTPSIWKSVVMGALQGLAGSAGATHFGGGVAAGVGGVLKAKQQAVDNANMQQQLQFESVKAADSHVQALKAARAADNEDAEAKQRISDMHDAAEEHA
jgi:hypothetical protein